MVDVDVEGEDEKFGANLADFPAVFFIFVMKHKCKITKMTVS